MLNKPIIMLKVKPNLNLMQSGNTAKNVKEGNTSHPIEVVSLEATAVLLVSTYVHMIAKTESRGIDAKTDASNMERSDITLTSTIMQAEIKTLIA